MPSRQWFKVHHPEWLGGSLRQERPATRGIFIDILALAASGRYGDIGHIKLGDGVGYSDEQIARVLKLDKSVWQMHKGILVDRDCITIDDDNCITITNWGKYQSEYQRQRAYRGYKTRRGEEVPESEDEEVEEKPEPKKKEEKSESKISDTRLAQILEIYEYWQTQKIVLHRKMTDKIKRKIHAQLGNYPVEDIKDAIHTYSQVVNNPKDYYFDFRWTIMDFMDRGIEKFIDRDIAFSNYKRDDNGTHRSDTKGRQRSLPKDYHSPDEARHQVELEG